MVGIDTNTSEVDNILQTIEDDQHFLRRMGTMLANMLMSTVTCTLPCSLSDTTTSIDPTISNQTRENSVSYNNILTITFHCISLRIMKLDLIPEECVY
ncbi:unnamed protein product [Schistosoma bovis]|nr:unnamed protein product [Schistosoma bovis]